MLAHVDADSFFASVIVRQNPRYQGKPLLATGMGGGCVIAASYEAKALGVKTGMALKEALTLTPDAIRVPSDFQEAGLASEQIEQILRRSCPLVEQASIDEWYLDLRALVGGSPVDAAGWGARTQAEVQRATGLWVSVGVAESRLLAKMAGEYRKPRGVTVLQDDLHGPPPLALRHPGTTVTGIRAMLQDRPAAAIPGIGHRRMTHVEARGWKTAWDIAVAPTAEMVELCGRPGAEMQRELLGECLAGVSSETAPPKSVSRARSFRRENEPQTLWAHLLRHLEYTVLKMRRHGLACRGISVWLRDDQYGYESAHASLPQPSATEESIQPYVRRALRSLYQKRKSYTQVGLALWRLESQGAVQFSLFEEAERTCRSEDVQRTLDVIHERFGRNAITKGSALSVKSGTKQGLEMPVYEAR